MLGVGDFIQKNASLTPLFFFHKGIVHDERPAKEVHVQLARGTLIISFDFIYPMPSGGEIAYLG